MNGPDALAGVRRGVRPTLRETSTETAASTDQDTVAGAVPGTATGADFPAPRGGVNQGPGGRGRRERPDRERPEMAPERPVDRPARLSLSNRSEERRVGKEC